MPKKYDFTFSGSDQDVDEDWLTCDPQAFWWAGCRKVPQWSDEVGRVAWAMSKYVSY